MTGGAVMKIKYECIREDVLDNLIKNALGLVRLGDLLDKTKDEWGQTSIDDTFLMKVTRGNKLVDYLTFDVFKLDDDDRFAVYVKSVYRFKCGYHYCALTEDGLRSCIRSIISHILKTYKRQYRERGAA